MNYKEPTINMPLYFQYSALILLDILQSSQSSEAVLQQHFRAQAKWGKNDRRLVVDAVMNGFRHLQQMVDKNDELGLWLGNPYRTPQEKFSKVWKESIAKWLANLTLQNLKTADQPTHNSRPNNLPEWLWQKWCDTLTTEKSSKALENHALKLNAYNTRAPLDIRVNPWRINVAKASKILIAAGFIVKRLPSTSFGLRLSAPDNQPLPSLQKLSLLQTGQVSIQDVGSQWISQAMPLKARAGLWVDYCAGSGGKTLALLSRLAGGHHKNHGARGLLLACDSEAHRLALCTTRVNLALAGKDIGISVEQVVLANEIANSAQHGVSHLSAIRSLHQRYAKRANGVLVDAPCSALGTLRRAPDLPWRLTPEKLNTLITLQHDILSQAANWVMPGGFLLYATCSWLPEENQAVVDIFLANNHDFSPYALPDNFTTLILEDKLNAKKIEKPWHLSVSPYHHQSDGYYFALMVRQK